MTNTCTSINVIVIKVVQVLTMHKYKGGRGQKAPYRSKAVRVPEPILETLDRLLEDFYAGKTLSESKTVIDSDTAIEKAKEILEQNKISKRPTKICLEKLVQVIYSDSSIKL